MLARPVDRAARRQVVVAVQGGDRAREVTIVAPRLRVLAASPSTNGAWGDRASAMHRCRWPRRPCPPAKWQTPPLLTDVAVTADRLAANGLPSCWRQSAR